MSETTEARPLRRHAALMDVDPVEEGADRVYAATDDEEIAIQLDRWLEMGRPSTVTVHVYPGDQLTDEDTNLVAYARDEMRRAGLYDDDSDYGGMIPDAVIDVVRAFSRAGHSGGSAALVTAILERVLRFQPLTPLTSNPDEWMEVGEGLWQSKRQPSVFSHDGGQTWHDLDDPATRGEGLQAPIDATREDEA